MNIMIEKDLMDYGTFKNELSDLIQKYRKELQSCGHKRNGGK